VLIRHSRASRVWLFFVAARTDSVALREQWAVSSSARLSLSLSRHQIEMPFSGHVLCVAVGRLAGLCFVCFLSLCDSLERDCFVLVHSAGHCWKIDPNLTVDETQAIDFQPRFVFYYLYFHSLSCVRLCCWLTEPDALSSPSDVKEIRRLLCNNTFIVSRNHCTAPWV